MFLKNHGSVIFSVLISYFKMTAQRPKRPLSQQSRGLDFELVKLVTKANGLLVASKMQF